MDTHTLMRSNRTFMDQLKKEKDNLYKELNSNILSNLTELVKLMGQIDAQLLDIKSKEKDLPLIDFWVIDPEIAEKFEELGQEIKNIEEQFKQREATNINRLETIRKSMEERERIETDLIAELSINAII